MSEIYSLVPEVRIAAEFCKKAEHQGADLPFGPIETSYAFEKWRQ
jgi:hypothetical protein